MKSFIDFISENLGELEHHLNSLGVDHSITHHAKDNAITVHKIVVKKEDRNKGIGSKAMKAITHHADKHGMSVRLTPSSAFGGNKARLTKFYKGHGFVENKGKHKDFSTRETMYRNPK